MLATAGDGSHRKERAAIQGAATRSTVRWSEIRDKHLEAIGREEVERGTYPLISQFQAHRLADMRKRRGLTQRDVAQAMGVTVGRVSRPDRKW